MQAFKKAHDVITLLVFPSDNVLSSRQVRASVEYVDASTFRYNGYEVTGCVNLQSENASVYGPEARRLSGILSFLQQMKPHLQGVIDDARRGTRSQHGYAAFFKSNFNMRKVIAKYQQLLDASPVIVSEERAKIIGTRTPQPIFHCINEGDPKTADIMELCNQNSRYGITDPIIVLSGTERIVICPSFFAVMQYPPAERICPTLGNNGKFKAGDGSLMQGGFQYVVYNLVLMYNWELYSTHINLDTLSDMQSAVELNSRQSLLNPESYGYYAGDVPPRPLLEMVTMTELWHANAQWALCSHQDRLRLFKKQEVECEEILGALKFCEFLQTKFENYLSTAARVVAVRQEHRTKLNGTAYIHQS
ncbi:MAG: hypothetical protein Q9179_002152 [Wetmoreana sp. 5 TL-2023]